MDTRTDITPEAQQGAMEAQQLKQRVHTIAIWDHDDYQAAAVDLKAVKSKRKELDDERKKMTKPIDEAKKAIMDWFRRPLGYLDDAERALKRAMLTYDQEEERRREAQARAEAAARKERERLEAEAQAAESSGHIEQAQAARDIAQAMPTTTGAAPAPKTDGISKRDNWVAEVVDLNVLVKAVAAGQVPIQAVHPNTVFLGQQARALKDALAYPGVKAENRPVMAVR